MMFVGMMVWKCQACIVQVSVVQRASGTIPFLYLLLFGSINRSPSLIYCIKTDDNNLASSPDSVHWLRQEGAWLRSYTSLMNVVGMCDERWLHPHNRDELTMCWLPSLGPESCSCSRVGSATLPR